MLLVIYKYMELLCVLNKKFNGHTRTHVQQKQRTEQQQERDTTNKYNKNKYNTNS